jgi:hypothetical protein
MLRRKTDLQEKNRGFHYIRIATNPTYTTVVCYESDVFRLIILPSVLFYQNSIT